MGGRTLSQFRPSADDVNTVITTIRLANVLLDRLAAVGATTNILYKIAEQAQKSARDVVQNGVTSPRQYYRAVVLVNFYVQKLIQRAVETDHAALIPAQFVKWNPNNIEDGQFVSPASDLEPQAGITYAPTQGYVDIWS
jgi:hypothetical protein